MMTPGRVDVLVRSDPASSLRPRQLECLELVAQGLQHKEVAARLGVTRSAVHKHLNAAYATLDVEGHIDAFRVLGWLVVR